MKTDLWWVEIDFIDSCRKKMFCLFNPSQKLRPVGSPYAATIEFQANALVKGIFNRVFDDES